MSNQSDQNEILLRYVLERLKQWRHFPAYQLERRVDVFFSFLLPGIIRNEFKLKKTDDLIVIPEFPLHKREVLGENDSNESIKVDFAVFSKTDKQIYLVELKTDNNSIEKKQLERMETAKNAGVQHLLKGVIECAIHSDSRRQRKYVHLIRELKNIECINVSDVFDELDLTADKPGLSGIFEELGRDENLETVVSNGWSNNEIELVLLYPGEKFFGLRSDVKNFLKNTSMRKVEISSLERLVENKELKIFLQHLGCCEPGRFNPKCIRG